jgi:hypothetical protein
MKRNLEQRLEEVRNWRTALQRDQPENDQGQKD